MITVADLAAWMEDFAPTALAESWDNVGLLLGDPSSTLEKVMICLTITPQSVEEALAEGAGAIVSHHPIMFRPVKTIRNDSIDTAHLWQLARGNIAVLSSHTSFDNTKGGINDGLATRLGLTAVTSLRPSIGPKRCKVVFFVPKGHRKATLAAAFEAGAGQIGAYEECSFTTSGRGTFFGTPGTQPAVGTAGQRETVEEWRVEVVTTETSLTRVLSAIRKAHPYEEPAIDVYPLIGKTDLAYGAGRVGQLAEPETLSSLASRIGQELATSNIQFVGDPSRPITRLAIVCGAGDDFLNDALRAGADALLTGEARFHRGLEADALGVGLIVAGHYATERPGVEDLAKRISEAFPSLHVWSSRREADPFRTIRADHLND